MRRAVAVLFLLTAVPLAVKSQAASRPDGPVDAIAMINYAQGHHFKVGDWAKYQISSGSPIEYKPDYTVTVLIAGEELWWGEECFWLETQISYAGSDPEVTASLLSYAVFEDSLPSTHFQKYVRKFFFGVDEQGHAVQQLGMLNRSIFTRRGADFNDPVRQTDTVGVEQVEVPKGNFQALHDTRYFRTAQNQATGDSTTHVELTAKDARWWSDRIPITSLVRMDTEKIMRRRAWRNGESENAPLQTIEHGNWRTALIDFGTGMKSTLVDARFQRPLSEQRTPAAKRRPAPAASRTPRTRG